MCWRVLSAKRADGGAKRANLAAIRSPLFLVLPKRAFGGRAVDGLGFGEVGAPPRSLVSPARRSSLPCRWLPQSACDGFADGVAGLADCGCASVSVVDHIRRAFIDRGSPQRRKVGDRRLR
jgi:hypothetical protein